MLVTVVAQKVSAVVRPVHVEISAIAELASLNKMSQPKMQRELALNQSQPVDLVLEKNRLQLNPGL